MATLAQLKLKEGDKAPSFLAAATTGSTISLESLKGKHVILFFYPKDNTSGCTKEACGFRDVYSQLKQLGVEVLGISTDSLSSHEKFRQKYQLPFPLLVDESHQIVQAYGVWGEKKFMGRKYQGTHRVTFWIGPDGRIRRIWATVKPDLHAQEVLAALQPQPNAIN